MSLRLSSITILLFISFILLPSSVSSQACKTTCGNTPVQYPFGTGPGCGDPRFQKYVTCDGQKLTLTTHTGCYPINIIDYNNQFLYIQDLTMTTCFSTQPSKGFGLDWDAPFSFLEDNVFALLDCSTISSPLYKSKNGGNGTYLPLCDNQDSSICSLLYSCLPITTLNLPISTCCVYTPVDLGPAFEMDLQKLQCNSYASIYSFNGHESNPEAWKYGVALKYKFSAKNDYPSACSICERSNGVCGYTEAYNSFVCNCDGGFNTTTDCYFTNSWNDGVRLLPLWIGTWLIYSLAGFLAWVFL